ncbi:tetratricopeptide repeat protein [Parabacteroides sp.]
MDKAIHYFAEAVEGGFAKSQCLLAEMYEKGNGVSKDIEKAKYWYQKAAEQGDEIATKRLKMLK